MIDRRIFSALLALCPAFVQRAIAGVALPAAEDETLTFLRNLRQVLLEQAETRRSIALLDRAIEDFDDVARLHGQADPPDREAVLTDVMDSAFPARRPVVKTTGEIQPFDVVRPNLRLQIFSTAYLENEGGLLYRALSPRTSVAIVEVTPGMSRFVRADEAKAWGLDVATIEAAAIENLDVASHDIPVAMDRLAGGSIVGMVGFGDGLDSSRLLVPAFRRRLLSLAATPLQAAVPSRDILMIWTPGVAPFEEMRSLVREFYDEGPYSRTDEIFDLKADSVTPI